MHIPIPIGIIRHGIITRIGIHRKGFPGILFKNDSFEHNYRALKKIIDGELWFRREILNALVHESLGSYPFFNHIHTTTPKITPKEIETLLFCRYYLNPDAVAKRIGVAYKSMRMYLHRLYQKLDLYSFSELNIFTRERAIDHYPLLHYKGLSGLVERPRESVALISDNMILSGRLRRILKKEFPHTAFFHVHRSDPSHRKKTKKIEPDITIIDRMDTFVPTFDLNLCNPCNPCLTNRSFLKFQGKYSGGAFSYRVSLQSIFQFYWFGTIYALQMPIW